MRNTVILFAVMVVIASCGEKAGKFSIDGVITNNTAKKVYLEEVPAATMQPVLVDSADLGKDGKFTLNAEPEESIMYNLRLDDNRFPLVSVISDTKKIDLSINMSKQSAQFPESYEVKGSPASQQLKDFITGFTEHLKGVFLAKREEDSLTRAGTPDSLLYPVMAEKDKLANNIMTFAKDAFAKASDPALILFEVGYYQPTAGNTAYGIQPLSDEEVVSVINEAATRFPAHKATSTVKAMMETRVQKRNQASQEEKLAPDMIGQQAPDFSSPDPSGKQISLSSFRGKYVLVDFWASWCGPCRRENPNVVIAYNKYKNKNFTVLGVSLDQEGDKGKWLKAVKDDKLTWTQVSDLKYFDTPVIELYKFKGIPFNVLVDPQGKVIGQELRGEELEAKLAEVLK